MEESDLIFVFVFDTYGSYVRSFHSTFYRKFKKFSFYTSGMKSPIHFK